MPRELTDIIERDLEALDEAIEGVKAKAAGGDLRAADRLANLTKTRARLATKIAKPPAVEPPAELAEKHRRFVEHYLANPNGVEAARAAGYQGSDKSLASMASRLLRRPDVSAAIAARTAGDERVATREERQRFWTSVMRGEPLKQWVEGREIEAPAPLKERLLASQLLGKSQADFVDRLKHEGEVQHEIVVAELPDNGRGDRELEPEGEA